MSSPFISQAMINIPDPSSYEWRKKKAYQSGIFYHETNARFEFSILLTRIGEIYTMVLTIQASITVRRRRCRYIIGIDLNELGLLNWQCCYFV